MQKAGLRGDGRLFVSSVDVADTASVNAGLSFPSFITDNGLFIERGGLVVRGGMRVWIVWAFRLP